MDEAVFRFRRKPSSNNADDDDTTLIIGTRKDYSYQRKRWNPRFQMLLALFITAVVLLPFWILIVHNDIPPCCPSTATATSKTITTSFLKVAAEGTNAIRPNRNGNKNATMSQQSQRSAAKVSNFQQHRQNQQLQHARRDVECRKPIHLPVPVVPTYWMNNVSQSYYYDYHHYHHYYYYSCVYNGTTVTIPLSPTFIIIGVQKSGTSSLYRYLSNHPNIAATIQREPQWFSYRYNKVLQEAQYELGLSPDEETWCYVRWRYYSENYMDNGTDEDDEEGTEKDQSSKDGSRFVTFEKSPRYIRWWDVPQRIQKTSPWTNKFILVLRNPIDRAFSSYKMDVKTIPNRTRESFEYYIQQELEYLYQIATATNREHSTKNRNEEDNDEGSKRAFPSLLSSHEKQRFQSSDFPYLGNISVCEIDERLDKPANVKNYIRFGLYAPQIRNWFQYYHRDSFLILQQEQMDQNVLQVFHRILDFVGVPIDRTIHHSFPRYNGGQNANVVLSNVTRAYLTAFFEPYNAELQQLLGSDWEQNW